MAKYKLHVDQETCIGCGACAATCPQYFEMQDADSGHKSKETKQEMDELDGPKEAAEICPVNAIHILEGEKKII